MIHVLLVDDHLLLRNRCRQFLEETIDIRVASEAESGQQALQLVAAFAFDAVILDLSLPDMNGIAVLRALQHQQPEVPVLVFTMNAESQYVITCKQAGAAGYLTKADASLELADAIRTIVKGKWYEPAWYANRHIVI